VSVCGENTSSIFTVTSTDHLVFQLGVKESRPGRSGVIMLPRGDIDGPRGALAILQG